MRRAFIIATITLALTRCGKKGELEYQDGAKLTYPKYYQSR